jgi:phenylalanyl-tRNA synthetase beta chain
MRFSENWLRTLVNPEMCSAALAEALTMAGLEVESLGRVAPQFEGVVVGEVLSAEKHPAASRLQVCRVSVGEAEPLTVVCGAPNVAPGMKAPYAKVGAQLPDKVIQTATIRGIESSGMLCSAGELGLSRDYSGLLVLPDAAPLGADIRDYLDLDDHVFALKLTPNRGDCLSVLGVAREVAAITGAPVQFPRCSPVCIVTDSALAVRVSAPEACPLYCGRVIVDLDQSAPSPVWLTRRLERSGLRSHGTVVDVTNYVMLELGQPLHAFDLDRVTGGITVRYGEPGERLMLINGETVELDREFLVIEDENNSLALAGIMGGAESAVGNETRQIFLESAFFAPEAIAGKSRRLGFGTDSSHRFERGVDFAKTRFALERATQLLTEICGGKAGPVTEVTHALPGREPIGLRLSRLARVLGVEISEADVMSLLERLHFEVHRKPGLFEVLPPSYRFDLKREADLIEELARIYGYERIPASRPRGELQVLAVPEARRGIHELRTLLAARDYQEIISYSFVDPDWEADLANNRDPIALKNPLASQMSVMRSTLWGGLLDCLRQNLNRKQSRARLFEIGRCFAQGEHGFSQPERLAALCYGGAYPEQWGIAFSPIDVFDLKADVEALFAPGEPRFQAAPHPALHPGKSARVELDAQWAGWIGELHPKWRQKYDLPQAPLLFELDLEVLLKRAIPAAQDLSRFPAVRRDLAVVVDRALTAEAVICALREAAPHVVSEITLFDVYHGEGIAPGEKSLAFRVLLQDTRKTLTDQEVDATMAELVKMLKRRFGARLRG